MKMNKLLALLLALVMVLSLAACNGGGTTSTPEESTGGDTTVTPEDKTLNIHLQAALESIDPALTSAGDDFEVIGTLVEGLLRADKDGNVIPGIAETYEISEDGLTWTFHLREAYWSNGTQVTADDFVYAWQRCITIPAQYSSLLETACIKNAAALLAMEPADAAAQIDTLGVTAQDDLTLVVEFDTPCPFFDTLMYFPVFYPVNRAFAEEKGDLFASSPENYLSNGPFVLTDYAPAATAFSMVKNETYYAADSVQIDGLNYKVILDPQQAYLAYQNGELDYCYLSSELADVLKDDPEFHSIASGYLWYMSPNINGDEAPVELKNLNIRKAIASAFDKDAICNSILKNGSIPADFCVPKNLATGPDGKDYRETSPVTFGVYDVAAAQEYWAAGLAELGQETVELTLIYDDEASITLVAQFIKAQLEANLTGITINLQPYPKKQRSDSMKAHTYDLGLCRWGPDYADPLTYFDLWTDGYTHNYGAWHSDEYMEIINNIKTGDIATDPAARWEAFHTIEQIIADEVVIMPVYQNCNAALIKSNVTGIEEHSVGLNRVYNNAVVG